MSCITPQSRRTTDRSASHPTHSYQNHLFALDCLRIRDLGGDWLDHSSFETGAQSDEVCGALVRDGLAFWDDLGIHITPRGRRVWADQRRALQDLAEMVRATPEGGYLLPPVPKAA